MDDKAARLAERAGRRARYVRVFALLALAGDTGCSAGPTLVGFVSAALGDDLKRGLLAAILFPVLILIGIALCRAVTKGATHENNT